MNQSLKRLLLEKIEEEWEKQYDKWGEENHNINSWYLILLEEVGELAKGMIECNVENIREETIHSITVLVQIFNKLWFGKEGLEK